MASKLVDCLKHTFKEEERTLLLGLFHLLMLCTTGCLVGGSLHHLLERIERETERHSGREEMKKRKGRRRRREKEEGENVAIRAKIKCTIIILSIHSSTLK